MRESCGNSSLLKREPAYFTVKEEESDERGDRKEGEGCPGRAGLDCTWKGLKGNISNMFVVILKAEEKRLNKL